MTKKSLVRSAPEAQGVSSTAILNFVDAVEKNIHELHSFMLLRHGVVVAEGWWSPYAPDRPHMLFSLSKSFTSTAIGMAVAEGRLSIDDPVISFFPEIITAEQAAQSNPNLAAMRVRHLLSMSTGHTEDPTNLIRSSKEKSWSLTFLSLPVPREPGSLFVYNSLATYMLSAILQKVTGEKLIDYLRPRLFKPLGISGARWESSPEGVNTGGWGLNIKTEDIARFGQLYLQKGVWEGQRLIEESWVEQATSKQISNGDDPNSDWAQGYCFQFWRCRHGAFRGDGAFGQYCVVMPEQDAVLAVTGGMDDMQPLLDLVWDILLPGMKSGPLVEAPEWVQQELAKRLEGLELTPPPGDAVTLVAAAPLAAAVSGKCYRVDANPYRIKKICCNFTAKRMALTFQVGASQREVVYGHGQWVMGDVHLTPDRFGATAASGVWVAPDTFVTTMRFYETPFYDTLTFHFSEDGAKLTLTGAANVSFGEKNFLSLTAEMETD